MQKPPGEVAQCLALLVLLLACAAPTAAQSISGYAVLNGRQEVRVFAVGGKGDQRVERERTKK